VEQPSENTRVISTVIHLFFLAIFLLVPLGVIVALISILRRNPRL